MLVNRLNDWAELPGANALPERRLPIIDCEVKALRSSREAFGA